MDDEQWVWHAGYDQEHERRREQLHEAERAELLRALKAMLQPSTERKSVRWFDLRPRSGQRRD